MQNKYIFVQQIHTGSVVFRWHQSLENLIFETHLSLQVHTSK